MNKAEILASLGALPAPERLEIMTELIRLEERDHPGLPSAQEAAMLDRELSDFQADPSVAPWDAIRERLGSTR